MPLKYGFSSPFAHFLIEAVMITGESQNRFKKIRVSSPLNGHKTIRNSYFAGKLAVLNHSGQST
jgi:hypothetical protein